jgi:hypothetical protein
MADRKKTPNILGDLLGGSAPASPPAEPPTAPAEPSPNRLPAKQQDGIAVKQQGDLPANEVAVKAERPVSAKPKAEEPSAKEPDTKEPNTKEPNTKEPNTKEPDAKKPAKREAVLLVRQHGGEPASRYAGKPVQQQNGKAVKALAADDDEAEGEEAGAKIKVTFYLSEDAVEALDEAQSKLRRLGRASGKKLAKSVTSKSALLEEAVRLVCQDLEENGAQSQIAEKLF